MKDSEIHELLDEWIGFDDLLFEDIGEPNGFNSFWNVQNNMWTLTSDLSDPLSLLLLSRQPLPYTAGHDDINVATLCRLLDRKSGWVLSFQDGWYGRSNNSCSITGYVMGRNLRIKHYVQGALSEQDAV